MTFYLQIIGFFKVESFPILSAFYLLSLLINKECVLPARSLGAFTWPKATNSAPPSAFRRKSWPSSFQQEKKDFGNQVSNFGDKAKDMAADAGAKAKDAASSVVQKVGDAASFVGKKAEDATAAIGSGMKSLGGTIRDTTSDKGMFGTASGAVADTLGVQRPLFARSWT